jgi:hypothetical protein
MTIIGGLFSLLNAFSKSKKPNYAIFVLVYAFWTMFGQIYLHAVEGITCTTIFGVQYLKHDLEYKCFDKQHFILIVAIIFPILVLLLVPTLWGAFRLYKNS